jgi:cell division septum initiation protein DivIVA
LQGRREQLQEQLAAVKASMDEVAQRVAAAQREHRAAQKAATHKLQTLQQVTRKLGLQLPASAAEAKQLVAQLQQQAADVPRR